ncbi:kinase-like domain-containing protein [Linnemannia elongata]|nr:kinase-like domain-containing protein [Linnemannia elongata]
MERMASTGSIKRPTSVHSTSSSYITSHIGSMTSSSLNLPDDSFSSNPEDYDIRLPIGYGSSAVVYNAYYKPFNKRVAIKVIDLDMFERNQIDELRRETQVMALCKHPNVLRVNGAFVTDSKLYIVTPYLSAGSCLDIMKTAYPDGFEEVAIATILKQALQGLDYLHKNGHIHRDVKAGNLLVDDDGSVLLADFGVSSSLMENGDRRGQRKTFVGTPCWMAPEVMEQAGYDYKADIWSFGITAIELATGHAPFAKYPPIKVLMLTLSNDPPTLDRDSTKHRYSKLFKEMIDSCLQKDPTRRPTAEKLLNHSFFKQAKKKAYLVAGLLHNLPPIEHRPHKRQVQKPIVIEKGISWNFDGDDAADSEEVRRPRTVTFERPDRPVSTATTDSAHSTGTAMTPTAETARTLDSLPDEAPSSQSTTPLTSHTGDKPVRKSRFVVEDSSTAASPALHPTTEAHPSPQAGLSHNMSSLSIQSGQNLQGLGVTPHGTEAGGLPEVKKGRFSVKDTSGTSSPVPSSIKTMPSDLLHSPSRSLTSSPIEGHSEGVRIVGASEQGSLPERKSRFEVHHTHGASGSVAPSTSSGTGTGSPGHGTSLSRESSQSRVAGDTGLSRDNSATRASRFSIETTNQSSQEAGPPSATVSATGTPNAAQSKRSRFQVSNVEGSNKPSLEQSADVFGSAHSTPTTSPTGSLMRGQQPALLEALGAQSVHSHLDTLYRQNEQQRVVLNELFAGLGLKPGPRTGGVQEGGPVNSGSVHRQEHSPMHFTLDRQLQVAVRENESLRRENEALKRELDRLRRGGS